jgi:hypothetical protein
MLVPDLRTVNEKMRDMRTASDVIGRIKVALGVDRDTDLSKLLNIPKTTISGWKGRESIPYEICVQVADDTGYSIDWLLTGVEPRKRHGIGEEHPPYSPVDPQEQAIVELYRALDEDARRDLRDAAQEKKRIRDLEQRIKDVEAMMAKIRGA